MDTNRYKKIKNPIIYFIFISLFLISFLILLNERLAILDKLVKSMAKPDEVIKIIDQNTEWSYIKEGENPGVGNVWSIDKYDAESWKKGYGDFGGGNVGETISRLKVKTEDGKNIPSYFFRHEFNMEEETLETIKGIKGKIEYDAAVIVYLNESIIFAGNVPQGGYSSNLDVGVSEHMEENSISSFEINDLSSLKAGKNIIGVEIHQKSMESNDVYFNFHELKLSTNELENVSYNMDGLVLEQGNTNEDVFINWITDSSDFYIVEYIEESKYKREKDLAKHGKTILMGRKKLKDTNIYVNKAQITRLKNNTKYMYRILKIGNIKGSKMYSFTSGKRNGFSFFLLEGPLIDQFSDNLEEVDFIITSIDKKEKQNIKTDQAFMIFRKPEILKQTPTLIVPGNYQNDEYEKELYDIQFSRAKEKGNYYITYQDSLIICLDSNDKDYKMHKRFLEDTILKTKKRWNLVTGYNIEDDEEFLNIFKELKIDLILDTKKHISRVDIDKDNITIKNYNIETEDIVEKVILNDR